MANIDSAMSSSVGLGNTITNMAQQRQRIMANANSAMLSPAGLGSVVTDMG
jgi:hypothetical protein